MDWNSKEGRELLRKAYPEGVLVPGVVTLGDYMCVPFVKYTIKDGAQQTVSWIHNPTGTRSPHEDVHGGVTGVFLAEFLPNPNHALTFHILLTEFAEAERGVRLIKEPAGYAWVQESDPNDHNVYWILNVYNPRFKQHGYPYDVDCSDAAEALVRARIILRERQK